MTIVQNIKYDNSCICPYAEEITTMSIEGNNKGIKLLNQIASLNLITPLRYFECSTCHYWVSRLVPVNEKSSTGPCEIQPLKNEHQTKVWPTFPLKWSHGGISCIQILARVRWWSESPAYNSSWSQICKHRPWSLSELTIQSLTKDRPY